MLINLNLDWDKIYKSNDNNLKGKNIHNLSISLVESKLLVLRNTFDLFIIIMLYYKIGLYKHNDIFIASYSSMLSSNSYRKLKDTSCFENNQNKSFTCVTNKDLDKANKLAKIESKSSLKLTEAIKKKIKSKNYVPPEVSLDLTLPDDCLKSINASTSKEQGNKSFDHNKIWKSPTHINKVCKKIPEKEYKIRDKIKPKVTKKLYTSSSNSSPSKLRCS